MRISDWSSDVCSSDLTQNNEVLVAESARARRLATVREEGLNIELGVAQQRCKELAALVEAEAAKAKVNAEKLSSSMRFSAILSMLTESCKSASSCYTNKQIRSID